MLLLASYALYLTWSRWFAGMLLVSTIANFLVGRWLRRKESGLVLAIGIVFNVALLSTFKYLPEAAGHFSSLQAFAHLALPLGLSFWTFQAMSYLFDQYRGEDLDPTVFEFALYIAFFPVTIAGPVCRLPDMLPQFRSDALTGWGNIARGLSRIATGAFMVELAKLLGRGILAGDGIISGFDRSTQWSGPDVWLLALGCGLQLFLDFAGYSHIAIGAAQAMGFTVPENFARPFHATTPSIFWTRWHMSLSFWIRDYVFFPLATLRREMWWRNFALIAAMVLFGVWHRASLLFLLWGGYHGVLLVLHRQVQLAGRRFDWQASGRLWTAFSWFVTMASINLGWIFFRANSIDEVRAMFASAVSPASYASHFLSGNLYLLVAAVALGYVLVACLAGVFEREPSGTGIAALLARSRWVWLPPLYALAMIFLWIVVGTQSGGRAQFMYQRF